MKGRMKINLELTGYEELIGALNEKINDLILGASLIAFSLKRIIKKK